VFGVVIKELGRDVFHSYDFSKIDGLVKTHKPAFRSWFDTSPRTENQTLAVLMIRSP
jgi:hypothetical protein